MAIGILIITAITLAKFRPVYSVYIDEQEIGCIQNKKEFEKFIEENLFNNKEQNIAFSNINAKVKYTSKLMIKDQETTEGEVFLAIKAKADITYFQYAVNVNGVERKYLKTEEQAKQVIEELKKELGEDINFSISTVYTKNLQTENEVEIANISNSIIEELKEEKRKEEATINGVYLSVNPISGNITSRYGSRESIRDHTHQGLDIAAPTGTKIKAVSDGTVSYSGVMGGYGNLIIIDHGNGITSYYGHCSKLLSKVGDKVLAGDVIAEVGSTGNSTGPHLHFEIRQNGKYVNPANYLYK